MDGLCCSKPKYTNKETSCYVIFNKVEITLNLFTKIALAGWAGICHCQLVSQAEGKGVFVHFESAIYYDKLQRIIKK